jgi:hypothetical protein
MKTLFLALLAVLACLGARAQVTVELSVDQDEFLPNEAIRVAVKISNNSGQQLHLGADQTWLVFGMESADGNVVEKTGEVPVVEAFDLESSQMATKYVNLQPYFQVSRPDRYKVTASVHIKEWGLTVNSHPVQFDIINGGELWSQNFGVATSTQGPPESRKYELIKANYLKEQLRLYVQVGTSDGAKVLKVAALGPMVSFNLPEEQVDRLSRLHVLWQSGGKSFSYAEISPDGAIVSHDTYDNFNSRPHLAVNDNGDVLVQGGVRRLKPGELPPVVIPPQQAAPTTNAPAKK